MCTSEPERCTELLQEKDNVIKYLKKTLFEKDEKFLNDVEEQGSEVDLLIDRIEQQINTLKEAYANQLESLEEIINEEKKLMIDTNRKKWENLIQDKDEIDKTYLHKLCSVVAFHEKAMLQTEKEQNEFRKSMRLKTDKCINDLIVQSDSLKSLCILNIEKMNYNYQLLLKKEQDHKMFRQHCRRYSTRMAAHITSLKKNIEEKNETLSNKMINYACKFDKLYEAIVLTDERYTALALSNAKMYFDLWNFNEKQANYYLTEILAFDKTLHEDILYIPWNSPQSCDSDQPKPLSVVKAMKQYEDLKSLNKTKTKLQKNELNELNIQPDNVTKIIFDALKDSFSCLIDGNKNNDAQQIPNNDQYLLEIENIFEVIGVKTEKESSLLVKSFLPFIMCSDCNKKSVTEWMEFSEKSKIEEEEKTDVTTEIEIDEVTFEDKKISESTNVGPEGQSEGASREDTLYLPHSKKDESGYHFANTQWSSLREKYSAIYSYTNCSVYGKYLKVCSRHFKQSDYVFADNTCFQKGHQLCISPLDVPKALRDFTLLNLQISSQKENCVSINEIFAKQRLSPVQTIIPQEVTEYWQSYLNLFSKKKIYLWDNMLCSIQQYQKMLHRRHNLKMEIRKLQRTNFDLRRLLQRYIHH